ncbi:Phosphotransferase enzyme [Aspergillus wentii]|nr:Phosphotransferase enzyme [Aspergillus wentii]
MRIRNFFHTIRSRFSRSVSVTRPARGMMETAHLSNGASHNDLFRYTSGRWVYNEQLRFAERYLKFDVFALKRIIAATFDRPASDIVKFFKLSEGGFNRVFQANFADGKCVIARLPYPSTTPEQYTIASEAATLNYLRLHGICTPDVYAWSSTKENPVGAEYIIMEKLSGTPLGDKWFPACGSIYYQRDLPQEKSIPLSDENAAVLSSTDIFRAVGERELAWSKDYAKPRLPYERLYREIYDFRHASPESHIRNLSDYLNMAHCLGFKAGTSLDRPVMRHPDFQPNNILVSNSNEIVGLIDWQHCSILPLGLVAGMPKHFENYGDPDSEKLKEPQLVLPSNYDSLPDSEKICVRETFRKRLIHFLYAAFTKRMNEDHYNAIFDNSVILHQRLFKSAGSPWEGDSITLKADMIRAIQSWPTLSSTDCVGYGKVTCSVPPVSYSDQVTRDTLEFDARQKEADVAMEQMQQVLGVDVLGWVPNDEYATAKKQAREMKNKMLEVAETPSDVTGVQNHFPFDDFDETA